MDEHDWLNNEDAKGAWEVLIGGQKDVLKAYPDHRDSVTEAVMYIDARVRELEEAARAVVEAKQKSGPFTAPRALWVAIALLNNVLNQEDSGDG